MAAALPTHRIRMKPRANVFRVMTVPKASPMPTCVGRFCWGFREDAANPATAPGVFPGEHAGFFAESRCGKQGGERSLVKACRERRCGTPSEIREPAHHGAGDGQPVEISRHHEGWCRVGGSEDSSAAAAGFSSLNFSIRYR